MCEHTSLVHPFQQPHVLRYTFSIYSAYIHRKVALTIAGKMKQIVRPRAHNRFTLFVSIHKSTVSVHCSHHHSAAQRSREKDASRVYYHPQRALNIHQLSIITIYSTHSRHISKAERLCAHSSNNIKNIQFPDRRI